MIKNLPGQSCSSVPLMQSGWLLHVLGSEMQGEAPKVPKGQSNSLERQGAGSE